MTVTPEVMAGAVGAFADRMTIYADADAGCAHEHFPEANDDATQELLMMCANELADGYTSGVDPAHLYHAVIHALHLMAAWGMTVGALGTITGDDTAVVIDWTALDGLPGIDETDSPESD